MSVSNIPKLNLKTQTPKDVIVGVGIVVGEVLFQSGVSEFNQHSLCVSLMRDFEVKSHYPNFVSKKNLQHNISTKTLVKDANY